MGIVIYDSFTEASDEALVDHTPDTGDSWTEALNSSGTEYAQVNATDDHVEATGSDNAGIIMVANPATTQVDADVEITLTGIHDTADKEFYIIGRYQDNNNLYAIRLQATAASNYAELMKISGGVYTSLDTAEPGLAVDDTWKLEMRGSAIKGYRDSGGGYVEVLSDTDGDISSAGKGGLGWGDIGPVGTAIRASWNGDDFTVTEFASTSTSTTITQSTSTSSSTSVSSTSSSTSISSTSVSTTTTVSSSTSTSISSTSTSITTTSSSTSTTLSSSTSTTISTSSSTSISTSTTVTTSTSTTISTSTTTTLAPATQLAAIDQAVPRGLMYVERVKFTEPYSLQLIGGDDQRLETFLAQKGLRSEDELRDSLDGEYHPKERPIVTPYPPEVRPPPGTAPPPGYPPSGAPGVLYPCGQIPIGGIIMWGGAIADVPECWSLCDGTPPTPDLRNRFMVSYGDKYNIGDTGGADTVDISHQHAVGTLAADSESAHTHGIGSYAAANESSHTHGSGTLATDNDTHDHAVDAGTTASDSHSHGVGTYGTNNADTAFTIDGGSTTTGTLQGHTHDITTGSSASDSHSHGPGTLDTDNDTHNHSVDSGSTGTGSAHTHTLSGTSAAGSAHGHTISGSTATGGDAAHDNRPAYYALAFIMRTS